MYIIKNMGNFLMRLWKKVQGKIFSRGDINYDITANNKSSSNIFIDDDVVNAGLSVLQQQLDLYPVSGEAAASGSLSELKINVLNSNLAASYELNLIEDANWEFGRERDFKTFLVENKEEVYVFVGLVAVGSLAAGAYYSLPVVYFILGADVPPCIA